MYIFTNSLNSKFQQRYTRTKADRLEKYFIPLNFAIKNTSDFSDTSVTYWLKPTEQQFELLYNEPKDWIICNKQQTSYYRVNYDEQNWKLIIDELNGPNFNTIHPLNRAQLINDVWNFGIYDYISLKHSLDLINYVKQETDFIPLISAFKVFKSLSIKFRHENNENMQKFIWESIEANYKKYSLQTYTPTTDNHVENLLRMDVVEFACSFGLESCLNEAETIYNDSPRIIHVDVRPAVYCGAMKAQNFLNIYPKYIDHLRALFSTTAIRRNNLIEIYEIIAGLGCSLDSDVLHT